MKLRTKDVFLNGVIRQNPALKLILGTCPTLALSVDAISSFGIGFAVLFVMIFTNFILSLLRNVIPEKIRLPAFILIIATFVTIVRMLLNKFAPNIAYSLGTFLPLIVVNCIIMARAESFASKNRPLISAVDGFSMGLGFLLAIIFMGIFREILGSGSVFNIHLWNFKIEFFAQPPGALFTYAIFIAAFTSVNNYINKRKAKAMALAANKPVATEAGT